MSDASRSESIESLLLDWHLKQLDDQQIKQVEGALTESPELASKSRTIRTILNLLDQYDAPEPPTDLADSVLAKIDEQTTYLPLSDAASAMPAGSAHDLSASPVLSLRELIAIAACITLFVGIFIPGYFKAQNFARRNLCRDHLRQIGTGLAAYAQANNGFIPYAGYVPGGSWLPTRVPNVQRASNTKPIFKLLRGKYVTDARVFICPSASHNRPMLAEDYGEFNDFAEPANISYSSQLMNVPEGRRLDKMDVMMVLIADQNPLFDSRAGHRISPYGENAINSVTHEEGAGQNVVYASGRGGWFTQPTIGVDRDNIYRAGKLMRYQGIEEPTSPTDTMLVP